RASLGKFVLRRAHRPAQVLLGQQRSNPAPEQGATAVSRYAKDDVIGKLALPTDGRDDGRNAGGDPFHHRDRGAPAIGIGLDADGHVGALVKSRGAIVLVDREDPRGADGSPQLREQSPSLWSGAAGCR